MEEQRALGWHPDPAAPDRERHWDGERWNAYRPRDGGTPSILPRADGPPGWRSTMSTRESQVMVIVFVVVALLVLGAILLSLS